MKKILSFIVVAFALGAASFGAKAQDVVLPQVPNTPRHVDYSVKESGYWFAVIPAAEFAFCLKHPSSLCTQIEISNGYRFSEFIKVGVGVAPRMYFSGNLNGVFSLPIFAEAHGNFISQYHSGWAPCWKVSTGYCAIEATGFLASASLGVRFGGVRNNFVLYLDYSFQTCNTGQLPRINLLGIKLGYEF